MPEGARKRDALAAALRELAMPGCLAVSAPFFSADELARLEAEAACLPMRRARPVAGKPGREVPQDFDICFPAPRKGELDRLASALEELVAEIAGREGYLSGPLALNDLAVQRYPPDSTGIGAHRDALRYRGLVFIVTLAGDSRFCLCDARDGRGARVLDDKPGMLGILSAPGFAGREGEEARPFHFVDRVRGGRLSIGLRHDSVAAA